MAKPALKNITIVWHLGFQKTGTTSFQSLMRRNEEVLSSYCTVFPKQHWTEDLLVAGTSYWQHPGRATKRALKAAAQDIRRDVQNQGQTFGVVSDENIIGLELYDNSGSVFDMAAAVMPVLEDAIKPAKSVFVFYTRDWDALMKSAYNQAVKQMRNRYDFDEFIKRASFKRAWGPHRKRLAGAVNGEVVFRDLTADGEAGWPMGGYILTRAGVPPKVLTQLEPPIGTNESLPPSALEFMLEMNRSHIHDYGLEIVRKKVLKHIKAFR
ncbi:MAG: hypothetical protein AAF393_17065 [Pseudomonadota bacterium]